LDESTETRLPAIAVPKSGIAPGAIGFIVANNVISAGPYEFKHLADLPVLRYIRSRRAVVGASPPMARFSTVGVGSDSQCRAKLGTTTGRNRMQNRLVSNRRYSASDLNFWEKKRNGQRKTKP
jgi:hypothetical protein